MSYKKVYYDEIWEITSKSATKCNEWLGELNEVKNALDEFQATYAFTGQAAESMKSYVSEVHGTLNQLMILIIQTYMAKAASYYNGYLNNVDMGDGSDYGAHYTTIVYNEVNESGSIKHKVDNVRNIMNAVAADANRVKNSISDLVVISASPKTQSLSDALDRAIKKATMVNKLVGIYESGHTNDFTEIDELIIQAKRIINSQLNKGRAPVVQYQAGGIAAFCDFEKISVNGQAAADYCNAFSKSAEGEKAMVLALNRDALLEEEAKASREWAKWITVGVAVVGGIVLTVVTAGGAAPGVCVGVGALVGGTTAATGCFVDNYIEKGDAFKEMNWSDFGKKVTIGVVTGAISGYAGAVAQGSAIKQPIQAAWNSAKYEMAEKAAGGAINTIWDVGEACVRRKPGDEIQSIFWKDVKEGARDTLVSGAGSFAGGWVKGKFAVDTSDKGYLQKVSEATAASTAENLAGGSVNTVFDLGEAVLDNDPNTTVKSALYENAKSTAGGIIGDAAGNVVSNIDTKGIKNTAAKTVVQTAQDTTADVFKKAGKGMTERTIDYGSGKLKDGGKIIDDIWEKDLDSGRDIAESAGKSFGEHVSDEVFKDKQYYVDMKRHDYDHDGKMTFVQFDDYAVTKEDFDAAQKVAGHGAYKDKTAQEILGLDRDTDLSSGKVRTVNIDMTEEYSYQRKTTDTVTVDGKYTFKKDYYQAANNVAGKGDYADKSVQDLLGVPEDTNVNKVTSKRVPNEDIGIGKKVELTSDSGTQATKVHISSMYHETKLEREQAKIKAAENKAAHPYSKKTYKDFYKKDAK
jgi:hypothetical protein